MLGVIKEVPDARLVFGVPDKQIELVLLERLRGESTDCTTKAMSESQTWQLEGLRSSSRGSASSKARKVLRLNSKALT